MELTGIIFDLDDTLYDSTGTVFARIVRQITRETAKQLGVPQKKVSAAYQQALKKEPSFMKATHQVCLLLAAGKKAQAVCKNAEKVYYSTVGIKNLKPFQGVHQMLARLRKKYKLGLVTFGGFERQNKKIETLKLRKLFHFIGIDQYSKLELTKRECFEDFLKKLNLKAGTVICIGDKIENEIKIGNNLGMTTVRVLHGRYGNTKPRDDDEIPDYTVKKVTDVERLIRQLNG